MKGELLTTADVAALLRVHPKHVYRLLKRGLPAHRVGGEWRFVRAEVLKWAGDTADASSRAEAAAGPPPIVAANGDVVVELLLRQLARERKPPVGLLLADRTIALEHLAADRILMAGHHGAPAPGHVDTRALEGRDGRLARVHLVRREVGIAFPKGASIRRLSDLARKRLASRPATAGIRAHVDRALLDAKTSLSALRVRATEVESHSHAVFAVLRGEADAALATAAWAARVGLAFLPLAAEAYDLLVHAADLGAPAVVGVCEVAQSQAFAREARAAGYDAESAGEIRYE